MIEPEVAFCDLWGDMELAEGLLKRIFRDVLEKCPEDMQFFNDRIDKTVLETIRHILDSEFLRRLVHRGRRYSRTNPARRSSSPSPGATTCRPSTSDISPKSTSSSRSSCTTIRARSSRFTCG